MLKKSTSPYWKYTLLGGVLVSALFVTSGCSSQASSHPSVDESSEVDALVLEAQQQRDWLEKMVDESREYNSPEAMISRGLSLIH